jgi:hypothetical protein
MSESLTQEKHRLVRFRGKFAVVWYEGRRRVRRSLGTDNREEASRRMALATGVRASDLPPIGALSNACKQSADVSSSLRAAVAVLDLSTKEQHRCASWVYFIGCGDFVKIGMSTHAPSRIEDMRTGNPYDMTIIHTIPGGRLVERKLQKRFSAHHHRHEWFHLSDDIRDWIEADKGSAPGSNEPDTVNAVGTRRQQTARATEAVSKKRRAIPPREEP